MHYTEMNNIMYADKTLYTKVACCANDKDLRQLRWRQAETDVGHAVMQVESSYLDNWRNSNPWRLSGRPDNSRTPC